MKLYYSPGACSLSPHIVLRELGLPATLEAVDLKTKRTDSGADFTALNPKGYVPALQLDDGEVLTEGVAIVQYLADRHAPGTLAPAAGTVERARLAAHLNFISAELHKAFGPLFNPALAPEARQAALATIGRKLDVMEQAPRFLGRRRLSVRDPDLGGPDGDRPRPLAAPPAVPPARRGAPRRAIRHGGRGAAAGGVRRKSA